MTSNFIWHGDSRLLIPQIQDRSMHLILTDPPYGMDYQSNMGTSPQARERSQKIASDGGLQEALVLWAQVLQALEPKVVLDAELYCFARWDLAHHFKSVLEACGWAVPMQIIWSKGDPGMGDLEGNWGCGYEVALYAKKGRRPVAYRRCAVIECDKVPPAKMIHPTEKPVFVFEKLIEMSTKPGDWVVDPFSGSGASSEAAMRLGRNSLGIELDEKYIRQSQARLTQGTLV